MHDSNHFTTLLEGNESAAYADSAYQSQTHTGVRSTVERVFGVLKLHYAIGKARYLGLGRNRTRVEIMCVAHNIKRGLSLRPGQFA